MACVYSELKEIEVAQDADEQHNQSTTKRTDVQTAPPSIRKQTFALVDAAINQFCDQNDKR